MLHHVVLFMQGYYSNGPLGEKAALERQVEERWEIRFLKRLLMS
jgi:hypothetical protein